jgi:hypothetical protein
MCHEDMLQLAEEHCAEELAKEPPDAEKQTSFKYEKAEHFYACKFCFCDVSKNKHTAAAEVFCCMHMARRSSTQISRTCCGMSARMYALGGHSCQPTHSSRSWQRRRTTPTCP